MKTEVEYSQPVLPDPEPGRYGWPWQTDTYVDVQFAAAEWPRITIVTPSFNQGKYLEATIRSVLLQNYPNLEYIIIDGGSTDNSLDIIKKYNDWIDFWVSETDRGQSNAINKGFSRATGKIFAWLNSDDMYAPGALRKVAEAFTDGDFNILSGHSVFVDSKGQKEGRFEAYPVDAHRLLSVRGGFSAPQQSTFWKRACWERYGPLAEDIHYVMDYEMWIKMTVAGERWKILDEDLSFFRHHSKQKTVDIPSNLQMLQERWSILERFCSSPNCNASYKKSAQRGFKELRVKMIRIRYEKEAKDNPNPFILYWVKAAIKYPGCMLIPAFYGLVFKKTL